MSLELGKAFLSACFLYHYNPEAVFITRGYHLLLRTVCYSSMFPSMHHLPMNHQGNSLPKAQTPLSSAADCQHIVLFAGSLKRVVSSNAALLSC